MTLHDLSGADTILRAQGFAGTTGGLVALVAELGEARALLATLLQDGDDLHALQGARALLDAELARRRVRGAR